jgi:hypothetical protein
VALAPESAVSTVQQAVSAAFARAGHAEPAYLVATPGEAARIESLG